MAEVPKQLTPLKPKGDPRSDAIRASHKGVSTDKMKYAGLVTNSKKARCKNCRLECPFRAGNTRLNPDALCSVPTLRAEAIRDRTAVAEWNDDKIKSFINEVLNLYRGILIEDVKTEIGNDKKLKRETVRDLNTMVNRLIQFKDKYYPPVIKSVTVNVDVKMEEMLQRWRKERTNLVVKKVKKEEKDGQG